MRSIAQVLIIQALAIVRPITIMKFLRDLISSGNGINKTVGGGSCMVSNCCLIDRSVFSNII
jgi:hypothetical protein